MQRCQVLGINAKINPSPRVNKDEWNDQMPFIDIKVRREMYRDAVLENNKPFSYLEVAREARTNGHQTIKSSALYSQGYNYGKRRNDVGADFGVVCISTYKTSCPFVRQYFILDLWVSRSPRGNREHHLS